MRPTQELLSRTQPSISYKSVAHFYMGEREPTLLCSNVFIWCSCVLSFLLLFLMHFVVFTHVTRGALVTVIVLMHLSLVELMCFSHIPFYT